MDKVCDKDCFNCTYADCVNDEMDHEDYREAADRDRELFITPRKRKRAAYQKAYNKANRDAYNKYKREYAWRKRHGSGDSV